MLTTNEVAEEMGVAYTTVMLWIKQGKLEAEKREHPRGDYYEVSPSALKKLDRGRKGRPKKDEADAALLPEGTPPPDLKPGPKPKTEEDPQSEVVGEKPKGKGEKKSDI